MERMKKFAVLRCSSPQMKAPQQRMVGLDEVCLRLTSADIDPEPKPYSYSCKASKKIKFRRITVEPRKKEPSNAD